MLKKVNERTVLTTNTYTLSKNLVQLWIPAVASLYFGLAGIWGWPYAEQVVGSLALIATFLGIVLKVTGSNWDKSGAAYDGQIVVQPNNGGLLYSLELDGDPAELQDKECVSFRVTNPGVAEDLPPPAV